MEGEPPKRPAQDWADFVDSGRKWQAIAISLIVILILVAGAGAYYLKHKDKNSTKTQSTTTTTQTVQAQITASTKTYSSPNFYLNITYPKDWTVTDSGGGVMTIVSPPTGLVMTGGQKVTGQITLMFRAKGGALTEFDKGNAVAAIDSQKITYAHPSQSQRANTYISFLNYAHSSATGIDGIYVTGNNGYTLGQAIPKTDIAGVDPIISVTFSKCSDKNCSGKSAPLTLSLKQDNSFLMPITKMLESLQIT